MDIIVIGAGPSGLMCACECSKNIKNNVILLDSNEKVGKKLYITGKGRCNVTNNVSVTDFMSNIVNNQKFLYSALYTFSPQDTISFFEKHGTPLKTERGNRVFPVSDRASDISKTFLHILKKQNVKIYYDSKVKRIEKLKDNKFLVKIKNKKDYIADAVVIATGGKSYSSTGSTGDGYLFAKLCGHKITEPLPALVPIKLKDYNSSLAGLSLKNIGLEVCLNNNKKYNQFGEMLFTHNGVSGPVVLSISSMINRESLTNAYLNIDLKPSLSIEQLDDRLLRDIKEFKNKNLSNYLRELLPSGLINEFLNKTNLDGNLKVCNITKDIRKSIIDTLKKFSYQIDSLQGFDFAIVTSGGINIKEINPKTMESKLIKNLFFIGEVLDVDALTGGFNIQIALSTGFVAGHYLNEMEVF